MKELIEFLDAHNLPSDENTVNTFEKYMEGILQWNEKINLTAIKDKDEFIKKHYIDSLIIEDIEEYRKGKSVIDIGTGGGFPGIPLAIVDKNKEFTLTDSLNKRLKVIDILTREIGIDNCEEIHGRAEILGRGPLRETFDIAVSRAVANLSTLSEYCLPFVKKGGYMFAYKGPDWENEIKEAERAIGILGGRVLRVENMSFADLNHNIIIIEKIKNTPKKYPRNPGTPSKSPL